ncbi:MAG: hypothetical protein FWC47_15440 [Oscillospiraceae bacterium]|nr:hypothetical protein [Oscillospiraceae bacterium]
MAVEKMYLTLVSGHKSKIESALSSIVTMGCFHAVNTFNSISYMNEHIYDNDEIKIDAKVIRNIQALTENKIEYIYKEKIEKIYDEILMSIPNISDKVMLQKDRILLNDYENVKEKIDLLFKEYSSIKEKISNNDLELIELDKNMRTLESMLNIDLDFSKFIDLNYMNFGIYSVTKDNFMKIRANYENIPSILIKALNEKDEYVYLTFTPKDNIDEAGKIFRSLNMVSLNMIKNFNGKPKDVYEQYKISHEALKAENIKCNEEMNDFIMKNYNLIVSLLESLNLIEKNSSLRTSACISDESFFISGWVNKNKIHEFEEVFKESKDFFVTKIGSDELNKKNFVPPTSLKNKHIFKSFEVLIKMFGIPSYNELDPTVFFALTYTLMFGLMFGDIGQGFIFFVAGLILYFKLRRTSLGGIVTCLGMSSMIFGMVYGSFFGVEIQKFYLVKPMENVNNVLITSIGFGVFLLTVSYVLHLFNSLKKRDYESAFFSKEGIAGLLLFLGLILFVVTKFLNIATMPTLVWILFFIILILLILLRSPFWNLISEKKFKFNEKKGDYFIENGFGIFELFLSILSNTLSFIRVGAFALNHVGLFLAVSSISNMISGNKFGFGSIIVYIIGNIIIIVLEGLVVFIQGLRLEYYELFSKYFEGRGSEFKPIDLDYMVDENVKKKTIESIMNH